MNPLEESAEIRRAVMEVADAHKDDLKRGLGLRFQVIGSVGEPVLRADGNVGPVALTVDGAEVRVLLCEEMTTKAHKEMLIKAALVFARERIETSGDLAERLQGMGFNVEPDEILRTDPDIQRHPRERVLQYLTAHGYGWRGEQLVKALSS